MAKAKLTISSKNYGSWSLRGWLLCRMAGLEFEEVMVSSDDPSTRAELLLLSPSFLVPGLMHDGTKVWDTLAIAEYLHELTRKPACCRGARGARALPRDLRRDAPGFVNLRSALPMNMKAHYPGFKAWAGARGDIDRITDDLARLPHGPQGPFGRRRATRCRNSSALSMHGKPTASRRPAGSTFTPMRAMCCCSLHWSAGSRRRSMRCSNCACSRRSACPRPCCRSGARTVMRRFPGR